MAALDAPTQPRIARSRQLRCPAPPPRRAVPPSGTATIGTELPTTIQRVKAPVAPTHTLARPSIGAEPEPRRSRRWIGILAGALAAGLASGAGLALSGVGVPPRAKAGPTSAQALRAVQGLGPQQSAAHQVEVTFTVDPNALPFDLGGRIRYRAVGQAQATVDLSAVGAADVAVRGSRVRVRLPAAQLDPPVVDESQSGVVSRDRRFLDRIELAASDVQTQVQQQLSDVALAQGVPAGAQQLAMQRVRAVLRRLGFSRVDVRAASS